MTPLLERLRDAQYDPMWANHCEISKATAKAAADEIAELRRALKCLVRQMPSFNDDTPAMRNARKLLKDPA